jgi:hypothetical protein
MKRSMRGRDGGSVRPRGGQTRGAVGTARHRGEERRDRADVPGALAAGERGRPCRLRQDDAAFELGRGGSASVRMGRARRRRRRPGGVPALPRERDPPRRTGGARGVAALSGPDGSTWSTRVPRLRHALGAIKQPLVLVLDDLHAVANPSCLDVVAALLAHVPAGSQIALASRSPALPLARWRAQGLVHEIGVTDLRLHEREAALLLEAAGVHLDASELSELTERTEGWPAGLYLAALSLQAGPPSAAGVAGVTDDDRFVFEYHARSPRCGTRRRTCGRSRRVLWSTASQMPPHMRSSTEVCLRNCASAAGSRDRSSRRTTGPGPRAHHPAGVRSACDG